MAPIQVFPHLTLLPAGQPGPDAVGVLTSPQMRRLIQDASLRYDWVIVDTPPVTLLPDARLLTGMVDAVVLVIAAGQTEHQFLARAIEARGREGIPGVEC